MKNKKTDIFGRNRPVIIGSFIILTLVTVFAVIWFFNTAPPDKLYITSGPQGSMFMRYAERYQKILGQNGVKLVILPSQGSEENLERLNDPSFKIDIGFVQGGVEENNGASNLVSLGSISYEPLYIFYRSPAPIGFLSELKGKSVAVGETGSGTRDLSRLLLSNNGINTAADTKLAGMDSDEAAKALLKGSIDAVFLMGDSVSSDKIRALLRTPGIRLYDFIQAEGYTRKIPFLHKLELPMGSVDFGSNIPSGNITLIGPTVEIIARKNLHPALSDLLLEAATEVHSGPGILKKRGEFPSAIEHDFRISRDANRFYKSGKNFVYRILPFWLASMLDRVIVMLLPLVVIFPSVIRGVPAFFQWRIKMRIYKWYRELLNIENKALKASPDERIKLAEELDLIESQVHFNVPASFAELYYVLRGHIIFVREQIVRGAIREK